MSSLVPGQIKRATGSTWVNCSAIGVGLEHACGSGKLVAESIVERVGLKLRYISSRKTQGNTYGEESTVEQKLLGSSEE